MRSKVLVPVVSFLVATLLWSPSGASGAVEPSPDASGDDAPPVTARLSIGELERKVRVLTNRKRVAHGCRRLKPHAALARAAGRHSARMADAGELSHQLPGEPGLLARIERAGYENPTRWGENVAVGQTTAKAVVTAWMRSRSHRRNILDCRYRHLGVGLARGQGVPWWTQDFGRR